MELSPLYSFNLDNLINEFIGAIKESTSTVNITKFLCGISSPLFVKQKIRGLANFGILENYPFLEVMDWVKNSSQGQPAKG
jgi:ATP-dependent DNA helicase RecQ